ncbi:CDP-alcohol phosphatidyltransferase [Oscillospiraceae bacterium]|nr:CDP-alcohol phosphatidyltransferase [Oscillospiraceae bacterium]
MTNEDTDSIVADSRGKILTIPNLLSVFRLCLIPLLVWLYCWKQAYAWTGSILILSGVTDLLDGYIARRFNAVSDLGKVLDPVADKLTQGAMLLCLLTRFPLMWLPLSLMVVRELFMATTGLWIIRKTGRVLGAEWHGKAATVLLYAAMILHVFWYAIPEMVSMLSIAICAVMIAVSFVLYGIRNIQVLKGG